MISKDEFKELVEDYYEQVKRTDKFCALFTNGFESPIIDWGYRMFDEVLKAYFNDEGKDWIAYYLYENGEKCYYQDDKRILLETIDDLWKLIEDCRK